MGWRFCSKHFCMYIGVKNALIPSYFLIRPQMFFIDAVTEQHNDCLVSLWPNLNNEVALIQIPLNTKEDEVATKMV